MYDFYDLLINNKKYDKQSILYHQKLILTSFTNKIKIPN